MKPKRQSYDPQTWKDEPELPEVDDFDNFDIDEEPDYDHEREEMIEEFGVNADNNNFY